MLLAAKTLLPKFSIGKYEQKTVNNFTAHLVCFITQQVHNIIFSEQEIEGNPNLLPEAKISSISEQLVDDLQADHVSDHALTQLESGLTRKLTYNYDLI